MTGCDCVFRAGRELIKEPEFCAREADKRGYLIGTYDSFNSIHDPALKGTEATWETAQFDKELYNTGAIVKRDG